MASRTLSFNVKRSTHVATVYWRANNAITGKLKGGDSNGTMWVTYYDGDGRKSPRASQTYAFENIPYSRYYYFSREAPSPGGYSYYYLGTPYATTGYPSSPPGKDFS